LCYQTKQLRDYEAQDSKSNVVIFDKMKSLSTKSSIDYLSRISQKPARQFYLVFDLAGYDDDEFHEKNLYPYNNSVNTFKSSLIDNIKFEMPPLVPLYNWALMPKDFICNKINKTNNCMDKEFCTCLHTLEVNLNDLVELVIIDGAGLNENHPVHLHGHSFAVLGLGKVFF
jgi:hypothetical protein